MAPKQLVIFDCDGTLVDSEHAILSAMNTAFAACALPSPRAADVRRIIGLSLDVGVAKLLPQEELRRCDDVVAAYRAAFFEQRRLRPPEALFDGIHECLVEIADGGAVLGIATGKSRRGLDAVLSALGLADLFATLQTADRHPGKPDPAMLQAAMAETGVAPADTVFIGDTSFDMEMAVNAGVDGIGVSWGYHHAEEITAAGATFIADTASQLPPAVGLER